MRERTWNLFCEMQEQGGINEVYKNGLLMQWINKDAEAQKEALRNESKVMVGVNKFKPESAKPAISNNNRLAKEFES